MGSVALTTDSCRLPAETIPPYYTQFPVQQLGLGPGEPEGELKTARLGLLFHSLHMAAAAHAGATSPL